MTSPPPRLIVLARPNGAGKSTAASRLLGERLGIATFVNGDTIAKGLSGFDPAASALAAGRLMLARIRELARRKTDFAFETTLASRNFVPWLRQLQDAGYRVGVMFLWLPHVDLAISRVRRRVALGGHDVPETTIRRRYIRGIANFHAVYAPLAECWWLYDNSVPAPCPIAHRECGVRTIIDSDTWKRTKTP